MIEILKIIISLILFAWVVVALMVTSVCIVDFIRGIISDLFE
jgi:hypothetical protein